MNTKYLKCPLVMVCLGGFMSAPELYQPGLLSRTRGHQALEGQVRRDFEFQRRYNQALADANRILGTMPTSKIPKKSKPKAKPNTNTNTNTNNSAIPSPSHIIDHALTPLPVLGPEFMSLDAKIWDEQASTVGGLARLNIPGCPYRCNRHNGLMGPECAIGCQWADRRIKIKDSKCQLFDVFQNDSHIVETLTAYWYRELEAFVIFEERLRLDLTSEETLLQSLSASLRLDSLIKRKLLDGPGVRRQSLMLNRHLGPTPAQLENFIKHWRVRQKDYFLQLLRVHQLLENTRQFYGQHPEDKAAAPSWAQYLVENLYDMKKLHEYYTSAYIMAVLGKCDLGGQDTLESVERMGYAPKNPLQEILKVLLELSRDLQNYEFQHKLAQLNYWLAPK